MATRRARPPYGSLVQVVEGSGLDSGRVGVVMHPRLGTPWLFLDGHGVPQIGLGHYNPFNPNREAIIVDSGAGRRGSIGQVFTMFWDRLREIKDDHGAPGASGAV